MLSPGSRGTYVPLLASWTRWWEIVLFGLLRKQGAEFWSGEQNVETSSLKDSSWVFSACARWSYCNVHVSGEWLVMLCGLSLEVPAEGSMSATGDCLVRLASFPGEVPYRPTSSNNFRRYRRFRSVSRPEPSTFTIYLSKSRTSRTVRLRSHFVGLFPDWFWIATRSPASRFGRELLCSASLFWQPWYHVRIANSFFSHVSVNAYHWK